MKKETGFNITKTEGNRSDRTKFSL